MADTLRYAGIYYDDALRLLDEAAKIYLPWHTETDPEDPLNGMKRLEAFRMHRDASLLDDEASELFWRTLQREESLVAAGTLIGMSVLSDSPARVDILAKMTGLPSLPATIVQSGALFKTEGDGETESISFEAAEDLDMAAETLEVYWDSTAKALYVGHLTMQFDGFDFSAAGYPSGYTYEPQYWDANYEVTPGVFGAWRAIPLATDGTSHLTADGTVSWDIENVNRMAASATWYRKWARTTIDSKEAYWIRFYPTVIGTGSPTTPAAVIGNADWYALVENALQGETVVETLGTTTTAAFQAFILGQENYVQGSVSDLVVGTGTSWVETDSLFLAGSADKVYVVERRTDGVYVKFGNDTNGKKPQSGQSVQCSYRTGAHNNGDVGVDTVVVNAGTSRLTDVTNPRPGSGWRAADGSTDESLEAMREIGPASLRALGRAVSIEDHATLAERWETSDGRAPIARAMPEKGGSGPRTVKVWCVGPAASTVAADDLTALEEYFNGTRYGAQVVDGVGMHNSTVDAENFSSLALAFTISMNVLTGYADGVEDAVTEALEDLLNPLATGSDGAYLWDDGRTVVEDRVKAAIIAAVPGFASFGSFAVVPSLPQTLAAGELPDGVTLTLTVTEV